jgi:glycosyltransferase involved in cell wall biosynthesis
MSGSPSPTAHPVGFSSIALVVDKRNWALDNIARHIKDGIERKHPVAVDIIFIEDFASEASFVNEIGKRRYDIVHFMWRRYLVDIFQCFVSTGRRARLERFLASAAISFTVCDHLYAEPEQLLADSHIYQLVDGYACVSRMLHDFYSTQLLLPQPSGILHDRTGLIAALTTRARTPAADRTLRVVWAGNSAWGQWLGLNDPKGIRIVQAALGKARMAGHSIEYTEFDSSKGQVASERIGEALLAADVLLCASETESTPLPVLEAMAAGCAVITTDVGVAREVLPAQQEPLIVGRNADAFAEALGRCAEDIEWTRRLGGHNRAAIESWCARPIESDWMGFFDKVHRNSRLTEKKQEKRNIVRSFAPGFAEARYNGLRYLIRRSALATKLANALAPRLRPLLSRIPSPFTHRRRARRLRNFRNMLMSKSDRAGDGTLALYTPMWLGVANSTRALFEHALPVPVSSQQRPWMVSRAEIEQYSAILQVLAPRRLIVSGGERLHRELAVRYKQNRPDAQIEVLWHGSQIQWSSAHERGLFEMWLDEHRVGTIAKFWVLKRGLDELLASQGISAELIENALPQKVRKARRLSDGEPIKVGIWSPRNDTLKNLTTQFLAFAGNQRFKIYHAIDDPALLDMLDRWQVPNVKVACGSMAHSQLLAWIAWMDVNMYVSLSECSPMIPLESISAGVPVMVGPSTTFFDDDPFLRRRLVVASPEQISSIRATVEELCRDYDAVADAVVRLGIRREPLLADTRRRLKHGLTVLSSDKRTVLPSWPLDERGTG